MGARLWFAASLSEEFHQGTEQQQAVLLRFDRFRRVGPTTGERGEGADSACLYEGE